MDHRKAASVLPEPVGATTSALRPAAIASQAPTCAGVGAANAASNQVRVGSLKDASAPVVRSSSLTPPSCPTAPTPPPANPRPPALARKTTGDVSVVRRMV